MRIGADEAGKGPVLGPMIAAAVRADPAVLPEGIADSKRLSAARRDELDRVLRAHPEIDVSVAAIPVERIDDPETDMNSLTVAGQAEAISRVAVDGDSAIVDAGDVSEARFARRVREAMEVDAGAQGSPVGDRTDADAQRSAVDVTAEHGADEAHPIVGAASIVAKVERDRRVKELTTEYGEVGSGYPNDPTTRAFLAEYVREHGRLPDCARSSWQTAADVLEAAEQSTLSEF